MCRCSTTPIDLTKIANELKVEPPTRTMIDCGDFSMPGLVRQGSITFKTGYDHGLALKDQLLDGKPIMVSMPGGYRTKAYVTNVTETALLDGLTEFGVTLQPTGAPMKEEPVVKKLKIRNRFYVAAPIVITESEQAQDNTAQNVPLAVSSGDRRGRWTRHTLKDALAHAEEILNNEPSKESVGIVQIIKIVRRKRAPIVVENVRG